MQAAIDCAEGTVIARTLCNQPASFQTPHSLAEDAAKLGAECGFSTEILEQPQIEALGMDSFLSVARGAKNTPPALIVMRYLQGGDAPVVGYVGKGLVYDSGGYSLKSNANMKNMFDDMGGAAAVIGAMSAIARQKLPVNIIGVVAACENKLSYDSYVPGDIIGSMAGKSIEVTNTDAEGRLTLADAITYAIRKEGCDVIVDIATLTGAAKAAVGKYSSAVISNDDALYTALQKAAYSSSEKVWRLDADEEMRSCLNSAVADIKNASGATTDGGGCILGGLFLQEFVEKKRWIHIDMAGVNFRAEPPAFTTTGATGYGAALLFYLARELPQYLKT
ncbi:MAG: leucyl aminopeptidase family protein [Christensenellales bacterium]